MKRTAGKYIDIASRSVSNPVHRNESTNIHHLSTSNNQIPMGNPSIPQISSLRISDSTHNGPPTRPELTPCEAARSNNTPERRIFGKDMRRLVKVVNAAILNPRESVAVINTALQGSLQMVDSVYVPWDVEEYYAECVKARMEHREKNKHRFPLPSFGSHGCPLTVVDVRGRIVLWYLPGLLSIRQQVSLKESYRHPESENLHSRLCGMEP
jgi:hypothetical protein